MQQPPYEKMSWTEIFAAAGIVEPYASEYIAKFEKEVIFVAHLPRMLEPDDGLWKVLGLRLGHVLTLRQWLAGTLEAVRQESARILAAQAAAAKEEEHTHPHASGAACECTRKAAGATMVAQVVWVCRTCIKKGGPYRMGTRPEEHYCVCACCVRVCHAGHDVYTSGEAVEAYCDCGLYFGDYKTECKIGGPPDPSAGVAK